MSAAPAVCRAWQRRLHRNRFGAQGVGHPRSRIGDALLARHVVKLAAQLRGRWSRLEEDERRRAFDIGADVARRRDAWRAQRHLPAWARLRAYCLVNDRYAEPTDRGSRMPPSTPPGRSAPWSAWTG